MEIQWIPLIFSIIIVIVTIGLGIYVQSSVKSAADMYVASRNVSVGMNAAAISGEYLSAASFMGIAGMIMKSGYDVLWYPVGYATGYLFLLLFIASPLRRFGAYTIPDFAEGRFDSPLFRKVAVVFVLCIGFFYTMPQMKGAGTTLVNLLGTPYWVGVALVGLVITFNVSLGGMKGITFVQAFQYWAKMFAISVPMIIMFIFVGGYGANMDNFSVDPETGKQLPVFKENTVIGYKPSTPINDIAFPAAISGTFKGDTNVIITTSKKTPADADKISTEQLVTSTLPTFKEEEKDGKAVKTYTFPAGSTFTTGKAIAVTKNGQPVKEIDPVTGKEKDMKVVAKFTVTPVDANDPSVQIAYQEGQVVPNAPNDRSWLMPYGPFTAKLGHPVLYTYSLILAILCGTAGLPHILVRFYTNPDGRSAKRTTFWVMILIGSFYLFPPMFGVLGRALSPELYAVAGGAKGTDSVVILLPLILNKFLPYLGDIMSGITAAGAFAAFMSTFSGLLVSMTGALAHDVYGNMINPKASADKKIKAFRISAVIAGTGAVILGIFVETFDINMMVGWAFAIAAASYFPMLLVSAWWRKTTAIGAGSGMLIGGTAALGAIVSTMLAEKKVLPGLLVWYQDNPVFYTLALQPAIWAVPLAIGLIFIVSTLTGDRVPKDVRHKMLILHAPEELDLKGDYIKDEDAPPGMAH